MGLSRRKHTRVWKISTRKNMRCRHGNCDALVSSGSKYCEAHQAERRDIGGASHLHGFMDISNREVSHADNFFRV